MPQAADERPARYSAGILVYRRKAGLNLFLVHPGGPFWRARDDGAWQIPKGGVGPDEAPLAAALREFREETGFDLAGQPAPLGRIRQTGGKWVEVFAHEADLDPAAIASNRFQLEWPPRSGRMILVPEVDRAAWFDLEAARTKMLPSQLPILALLDAHLARGA